MEFNLEDVSPITMVAEDYPLIDVTPGQLSRSKFVHPIPLAPHLIVFVDFHKKIFIYSFNIEHSLFLVGREMIAHVVVQCDLDK